MNLIENGQDSFKKAIKSLNDLDKNLLDELEYECKLKDIVINLHHSIETLFKYMIKEKDEFLLYSNCEEIFQSRALKKINCRNIQEKTIQFLDAIHRVIVLYNITIKKEDYNNLKSLNEKRNCLTHYEKTFEDNEIEHLIAQILPFLIELYSKNIKNFNHWAKINNIYEDTKNIKNNNNVWVINQYFILKQKNIIANEEIERLKNSPQEVQDKSNNKDEGVNYQYCPICNKPFFNPIEAYIFNAEQIISLGHCEYCDINIDRLDAQFVSLYYGNFDEYLNDNCAIDIGGLFANSLLSVDINISDELKNKMIQFICSDKTIFKQFKIIIKYYIEDIIKELIEPYAWKNYLQYNDKMEEIITNDITISTDITQIFDLELFESEDNLLIDKIEKVINSVNNFITFDKNLGQELINYIDYEYLIQEYGSYLDFEGKNNDAEIEFDVSFKFEDFKEMYKQYIESIE